jgi:hypothetical protein
MRDNEGDTGGTWSNVGGIPFWESPDVFVVPHGAPQPASTDSPEDLELTAGQGYDVYLRVHNEYGCSPVYGPISVFIDAAYPDMGFENWLPVTPGADLGQYATYGAPSTVIAPAYGDNIIGPFPQNSMTGWVPGDGGHKCLLVAISAPNEVAPVTSPHAPPILPPAYTSNQIAQRNLQIGDMCTFSITSPPPTGDSGLPTTANLVLGVSVTNATPPPGSNGGPVVTLTFTDPSKALFDAWSPQSIAMSDAGPPPVMVMYDNTSMSTIVTLETSDVALDAVPLIEGQSVSIRVLPGSTNPPTVDVSAILTDPTTGDILLQNGGTCMGTSISVQ